MKVLLHTLLIAVLETLLAVVLETVYWNLFWRPYWKLCWKVYWKLYWKLYGKLYWRLCIVLAWFVGDLVCLLDWVLCSWVFCVYIFVVCKHVMIKYIVYVRKAVLLSKCLFYTHFCEELIFITQHWAIDVPKPEISPQRLYPAPEDLALFSTGMRTHLLLYMRCCLIVLFFVSKPLYEGKESYHRQRLCGLHEPNSVLVTVLESASGTRPAIGLLPEGMNRQGRYTFSHLRDKSCTRLGINGRKILQ